MCCVQINEEGREEVNNKVLTKAHSTFNDLCYSPFATSSTGLAGDNDVCEWQKTVNKKSPAGLEITCHLMHLSVESTSPPWNSRYKPLDNEHAVIEKAPGSRQSPQYRLDMFASPNARRSTICCCRLTEIKRLTRSSTNQTGMKNSSVRLFGQCFRLYNWVGGWTGPNPPLDIIK
jgi:hypothetical protein